MASVVASPIRISKADLEPGDVLLSCGYDALSRFIARMDGGKYSHSAVWDGNWVVEATIGGVGKYHLEDEINAQWYVDVYRWHTEPPGHEIGDAEYPPEPVTQAADAIAITGARYDYDKLLLGAFLIWVSGRPESLKLRILIRLLGDRIERWIVEHIPLPAKRGMTCTEVVCKSFWEAAPPPRPLHDYGIITTIDGSRELRGLADLRNALSQPAGSAERAAANFKGYDARAVKLGYYFLRAEQIDNAQFTILEAIPSLTIGTRTKVGESVPLFFVSPRELAEKSNLRYIARLSENLIAPPPGSLWSDIVELFWDPIKFRLAPVPLRLAVGGVFIAHGLTNLVSGVAEVASRLQVIGLPMPSVCAALLVGLEIVGGVGIVLGLFTSVLAAALAVMTTTALLKVPGALHIGLRWMLLAGTLSLVALGDGAVSLGGWLKRR